MESGDLDFLDLDDDEDDVGWDTAIGDVISFLGVLTEGIPPISLARYERDDGILVSTIGPVLDRRDNKFETAVCHELYSERLIIVEQYGDESAALVGHEKWVSIMTHEPLPEVLTDVYYKSIGLDSVAEYPAKN